MPPNRSCWLQFPSGATTDTKGFWSRVWARLTVEAWIKLGPTEQWSQPKQLIHRMSVWNVSFTIKHVVWGRPCCGLISSVTGGARSGVQQVFPVPSSDADIYSAAQSFISLFPGNYLTLCTRVSSASFKVSFKLHKEWLRVCFFL